MSDIKPAMSKFWGNRALNLHLASFFNFVELHRWRQCYRLARECSKTVLAKSCPLWLSAYLTQTYPAIIVDGIHKFLLSSGGGVTGSTSLKVLTGAPWPCSDVDMAVQLSAPSVQAIQSLIDDLGDWFWQLELTDNLDRKEEAQGIPVPTIGLPLPGYAMGGVSEAELAGFLEGKTCKQLPELTALAQQVLNERKRAAEIERRATAARAVLDAQRIILKLLARLSGITRRGYCNHLTAACCTIILLDPVTEKECICVKRQRIEPACSARHFKLDILLIPSAKPYDWIAENFDYDICANLITSRSVHCLAPHGLSAGRAVMRLDQYCCNPEVVSDINGCNQWEAKSWSADDGDPQYDDQQYYGNDWVRIMIYWRTSRPVRQVRHKYDYSCQCPEIIFERISKYRRRGYHVELAIPE